VAFRYSVTFMIRPRILTTTPPVLGISFFLYCSFRGFGCGKAMWFDGLFRKDRRVARVRTRRCDVRSANDGARKGERVELTQTLEVLMPSPGETMRAVLVIAALLELASPSLAFAEPPRRCGARSSLWWTHNQHENAEGYCQCSRQTSHAEERAFRKLRTMSNRNRSLS
jgi:hypothetical protein